MVNFTDNMVMSINDTQTLSTDVVYFDFSKAFDSVNHDLIRDKLKNCYSIDGRLLKFLKNYLCDREQRVVLDGAKSPAKLTCHFVTHSNRQRVLYLALVRSQFEHCSPVWRPCSSTLMNKFEVFQKKCLKWILSEQELSYSNEVYVRKCKQLYTSLIL